MRTLGYSTTLPPFLKVRNKLWFVLSYKTALEATDPDAPQHTLVTGTLGEEDILADLRSLLASTSAAGASTVTVDVRLAVRSPVALAKFMSNQNSSIARNHEFSRVIQVAGAPAHAIWAIAARLDAEAETPSASALRPSDILHERLAAHSMPSLVRALYHWIAVTQIMQMYADELIRVEVSIDCMLCDCCFVFLGFCHSFFF